jgi:hypothetical protein
MSFRLTGLDLAPRGRAVATALLVCCAGSVAPAAAAGLFEGMAGVWRGDGSIAWTTGETEHMRCNAKYEVERDGNRIIQALTCATDSTRLIIKSTITYNPDAGAITGDWSETTYGINGYVTGTASTGAVNAHVQSTDHRFNAEVTVATKGAIQTVTIVPKGLDVTNVAVKLKRGGSAVAADE